MSRLPRSLYDWLAAAGFALLLSLVLAAAASAPQTPHDAVPVVLEAVPGDRGARFSGDGKALLIAAGRGSEHVALLRFSLPPPAADAGRWVLWMGRNPVDRVYLRGGDWRSVERDFFLPADDAGVLPSGYQFPLPATWQGEVTLELHAAGSLSSALRPRLLREHAAMRIEQRGAALAAAVYAALFTLALLTLALFTAAHDRIYLSFFASVVSALLLAAALNGHLYRVPGFGLLSLWRGQGVWALGLLFLIAGLQLIQRYAGAAVTAPRLARYVDGLCVALALLAALCLLGASALDAWIGALGTIAWVVAAIAAAALLGNAARDGVHMARILLLLVVAGAGLVAASAFAAQGSWADPVWLRYGLQFVMVTAFAVLAVGLISRISEYRDQRDRERLARADSERRMRREATRSGLSVALQAKLRTLDAGDVEWAAFRMLLDHVLPEVPVEFAAVLAHSHQGSEVRVVAPQSYKDTLDEIAARRTLMLKRHAANGITAQQPVTVAGRQSLVAMEAVLPLPLRAPGWGVLLLQRAGGEGFASEELTLAGELARLTVAQIEQAMATIHLRRSAEVDALTGSFNRRTIDQWLLRSFGESARDGHPISVLFIDMDHFKSINDRYGHACGDEALRRVAATLRGVLGEGDLLGRYGGEEFIVVLPGRGAAAARAIGEQMRDAVERLRVDWEGHTLQLTVSIGVATRLDKETTPAATIDRADKALYAAKRAGRNCVQVAPAVFT